MTPLLQQFYNAMLSYETRLRFYKFRHPEEYRQLREKVHPSAKGDFSLKPYDEHHCIFIHITKTAGTSVAKSLFNYLPYHYTAIDYRVIYGKQKFNKYYKFAFVRNPWDRLYSAYRYLKSGGWNDNDKAWAEANLANFDNFTDFIENWLTHGNIKKHLHFMPQHHFICDPKGQLLVDYLAYFETINDDFNKIAQHLGINAKIGHHNANPAESYLHVYNDKTQAIVADVYARDIALFGYQFEGIKQRTVIG